MVSLLLHFVWCILDTTLHIFYTLDLKVYAKIKKIALRESRSMTNMIEYLIKKEIGAYEAEHGEIEVTDEDLALE